tara:strand:- start:6206 stop:6907 length:702 start_codon:yes stop_codon:yes gene_type:complete
MSLDVDFPIKIIRTDRRKSASIDVENEVVRVSIPSTLSDQRVEALITQRMPWIQSKLDEQRRATPRRNVEYIDGESISYLGRNYRLKLEHGITKSAKLKNGKLVVNIPAARANGRFERYIRTTVEDWYKKQALKHFQAKSARYGKQIGVTPKSIDISDFKARWGSCSPEGDITYHWRVIAASHRIVDYIVVHELCHLIEHSHSPRYWQLVENIMPDYRERREWLKTNGGSLLN